FEAPNRPPGAPLHYGFNDRRDTGKVQSALQERLDCDLVGGVQNHRAQTAGACRGLCEGQAAELDGVGGAEVEPPALDQIEGLYTGVDALWPRERVRDRGAHVRSAELCEYRAVDVFDQRMHDALRVHDDLDLRRGRPEQQTGLDELQPLVHERRGVDRDLA